MQLSLPFLLFANLLTRGFGVLGFWGLGVHLLEFFVLYKLFLLTIYHVRKRYNFPF